MNSPQSMESWSAFILFLAFILFQICTLAGFLWQVVRIFSTLGLPNLTHHLVSWKEWSSPFWETEEIGYDKRWDDGQNTPGFLQVLDVFFQHFICASWVTLTIRFGGNFLRFEKKLLGFFFSFFISIVWGIIRYIGRTGYFHLNAFAIEGTKSSTSPILFCYIVYFWWLLILCTFTLLQSVKMTCGAEVLWVLLDEMSP